MPSEILRLNQTPKERIKQQKTSVERKESKREWYLKNKDEHIQKCLKWTEENLESRKLHIQKYVQKNSAQTKYRKPSHMKKLRELEK